MIISLKLSVTINVHANSKVSNTNSSFLAFHCMAITYEAAVANVS